MNRRPMIGVLIGAVLAAWMTIPANACTCFFISHDKAKAVGKNYDWMMSDGLVIVNKRHLRKPFDIVPTEDTAYWTSTYGSVTFNQYGRDLPQGGMNEAGLVIEILWLNGTEYPTEDERRALGAGQWIQYQLDTAGSVDEVIASFDSLRIQAQVQTHFFVADRHGETASIEFLQGRLVCHRGESMPAKTLTNSIYEESKAYLRIHQGWGGEAPIPESNSSLDRFVRATTLARDYELTDNVTPTDYTFEVLKRVAQQNDTQWSIVYDLNHLQIHFLTSESRGIKLLDLKELDFSCGTEVKIVDIDLSAEGNILPRMCRYTREANRDLIDRSYGGTSFLSNLSEDVLDRIARYPDHSICVE